MNRNQYIICFLMFLSVYFLMINKNKVVENIGDCGKLTGLALLHCKTNCIPAGFKKTDCANQFY